MFPTIRPGMSTVPKQFVVPPDVSHVLGGYWDVYRIAFLSGGRLAGVPFSMYPNRFRGWSRGLGPGCGKLLILHPEVPARTSSDLGSGARDRPIREEDQLAVSPQHDLGSGGRDPAELSRLQVIVP